MTTTTTTTPTSGAADLPEALRLAAWLQEGAWHQMRLGDVEAAGRELRRLHIEITDLRAQLESIGAEPGAHVQNPAENEHVACDVAKNGAEMNMSTQQQECGNTPYDEGPIALAQPVAPRGAADGFFLLLPQRPKPEAPAGTAGLDWDAYSGAQMLAFGRDCSDAAIAALRTQQPAPGQQGTAAPTVEQVENEVSMGADAWDLVDPNELISTVLRLATPAQTEVTNLRKALQFYADGEHFIKSDRDAWDTMSGEPQNYWCDEAGTATVEDGSIARLALSGQVVRFEGDASPSPTPPQAPTGDTQGIYGPFNCAFVGAGVWAGIVDELPPNLVGKKVYVTTAHQAAGAGEDAARYQLVRRGQHWSVIDGIGNDLRGEALDAAVDTVRSKKGGAA